MVLKCLVLCLITIFAARFLHLYACLTCSSGHASFLYPLLAHHHLCYVDVYCVFFIFFISVICYISLWLLLAYLWTYFLFRSSFPLIPNSVWYMIVFWLFIFNLIVYKFSVQKKITSAMFTLPKIKGLPECLLYACQISHSSKFSHFNVSNQSHLLLSKNDIHQLLPYIFKRQP